MRYWPTIVYALLYFKYDGMSQSVTSVPSSVDLTNYPFQSTTLQVLVSVDVAWDFDMTNYISGYSYSLDISCQVPSTGSIRLYNVQLPSTWILFRTVTCDASTNQVSTSIPAGLRVRFTADGALVGFPSFSGQLRVSALPTSLSPSAFVISNTSMILSAASPISSLSVGTSRSINSLAVQSSGVISSTYSVYPTSLSSRASSWLITAVVSSSISPIASSVISQFSVLPTASIFDETASFESTSWISAESETNVDVIVTSDNASKSSAKKAIVHGDLKNADASTIDYKHITMTFGPFVLVSLVIIIPLIIWMVRNKASAKAVNKAETEAAAVPPQFSQKIVSNSAIVTGLSSIMTNTSSIRVVTEMRTTSSVDTQVNTNHGLAIPVYMEYHEGVDFTSNYQLKRGGMSIISMGSPVNPKLAAQSDRILLKRILTENEPNPDAFIQEVALMELLSSHPNIARIYGYCTNPKIMILKYYPNGDLKDWLTATTHQKSNMKLKVQLLEDISKALSFIHLRGIIHCDLKPANVLLDQGKKRPVAVLNDFGLAQLVNGKSVLVRGFKFSTAMGFSLAYAAPELVAMICRGQPAAMQFGIDTYGLGLITYSVLVGQKSTWK